MTVDLQGAYECLVLLLNYLYNLGFRLRATTMGSDVDTDFITVEGTHRIAFGHEKGLAVRISDYGILAVASADENTCRLIASLRGFVLAGRDFNNLTVEGHFHKLQGNVALLGCSGRTDCVCHLLIIICVVFLLRDEFLHLLREGGGAS